MYFISINRLKNLFNIYKNLTVVLKCDLAVDWKCSIAWYNLYSSDLGKILRDMIIVIHVKNRVAKLMRYAFVEKKEAGARGKGERGSFQAKCIKSPRRDLPRREEEEGRPLLIPLSPLPLTDNPVNRREEQKKIVSARMRREKSAKKN